MYKRGQATDFSLEISEAFYVQEVFDDIRKRERHQTEKRVCTVLKNLE